VTALANAEQAGDTTDRSGIFEPKTEEEAKAYEELAELFAHFDSDGSGELGKEEVAELLATLGTTLNDEVLRPYLAPRPRPLCVRARGHERAAKCRYAACVLGCVTSCCVVHIVPALS